MSRSVIDMTGDVFGRLTVVRLASRDARGGATWECVCRCGATHIVSRSNLRSGAVRSCGCLHALLTGLRRRAARRPLPPCSVAGCGLPAREFDRKLCRTHGQRKRRHGSADVVVSRDEFRVRCRVAALKRCRPLSPQTYPKLFGRHAHRVVAEQKIGRPIATGEHVHHIDHDKHNYHPDNLEVMTARDHHRLHALSRRLA